VGKPEVKRSLGRPGVDGSIILRWILGKWDVGIWTGSSWLRIGTGRGHKMLGISGLAENRFILK